MMKKKVIYQGQFVGWLEATGDAKKDALASHEVIVKSGFKKEKISEIDQIFGQAHSFCKMSAAAYDKGLSAKKHDPSFFAPFIVNSSFSIELYLKTIHLILGRKIKGHKLKVLYEELPNKVRDEIEEDARNDLDTKHLEKGESLGDAISTFSDSFVEWRYLYEKEESSEVRILPLIFIMRVLHTYVQKKK